MRIRKRDGNKEHHFQLRGVVGISLVGREKAYHWSPLPRLRQADEIRGAGDMTVLLQKEIIKLLANGPMTDGEIRNRLNSQMWDVSHEDVLDALL